MADRLDNTSGLTRRRKRARSGNASRQLYERQWRRGECGMSAGAWLVGGVLAVLVGWFERESRLRVVSLVLGWRSWKWLVPLIIWDAFLGGLTAEIFGSKLLGVPEGPLAWAVIGLSQQVVRGVGLRLSPGNPESDLSLAPAYRLVTGRLEDRFTGHLTSLRLDRAQLLAEWQGSAGQASCPVEEDGGSRERRPARPLLPGRRCRLTALRHRRGLQGRANEPTDPRCLPTATSRTSRKTQSGSEG